MKNKLLIKTSNAFTLSNQFSTNNYKNSNFSKFKFYMNSLSLKFFTGKTETGFKFTTPKLRMKSVKPIMPPPGDNLEIPSKYNFIIRLICSL